MKFDEKIYFDTVRPMFGSLSQEQVNGQKYLLAFFEKQEYEDLRFPAYMLATTKHETASTMLPIEEYGKGKGKSYGTPHPETGQTYYGRGDVQLTWYDNYLRADEELGFTGEDSLVEFPENALDPAVAATIMDRGMQEGWFRKGHKLDRYFNDNANNPFEAREIINGDKNLKPSWAGGRKIGDIVADYHKVFLNALQSSATFESNTDLKVVIEITAPKGVTVEIIQK